MPKIDIETRKITLPNYKDSEVVIYKQAPYKALIGLDENTTNAEAVERFLPDIIVDWNFTDEDNNKLEITYDNLLKLPAEDVDYLIQECIKSSVSTLKKKTSEGLAATSKDTK